MTSFCAWPTSSAAAAWSRSSSSCARTPQLDEETRGWVLALAESENFLLAAALYLKRSRDVN